MSLASPTESNSPNAQYSQLKKQHDRLLQDLLAVLDAVDQACAHWQDSEAEPVQAHHPLPDALNSPPPTPLNPFQQTAKAVLDRIAKTLGLVGASPDSSPQNQAEQAIDTNPESESLAEIIASGREGAELIQRSLLDALRQQQITPISALGQPFNSQTMFAIGREPSPDLPENTVLEEIVRGYQQGSQVLREAQVIVASK